MGEFIISYLDAFSCVTWAIVGAVMLITLPPIIVAILYLLSLVIFLPILLVLTKFFSLLSRLADKMEDWSDDTANWLMDLGDKIW